MFESQVGSTSLATRLRRLDEVSWNFEGAKSRSPLSATHFHPARFISQLPSILITLLSKPGDLILDPFCGSGTTLVEAQRLSRPAIGLDVNPISIMISQAKTSRISTKEAQSALHQLGRALVKDAPLAMTGVPPTVQLAKWYSPAVALLLAKLFSDIEKTHSPDSKLIKLFCFSSILLKVCRETRHWGYVCDNTAPKDSPPRKVAEILQRSIQEISDGLAGRTFDGGDHQNVEVYQKAAKRVAEAVAPESVDLVVTSPPYYGVVDYVKSQRLSLEWLGIDIKEHRLLETGARSKRHRLTAETEFAKDIEQSFRAIMDVMKPGAICAVVFGVSPSRGFSFERFLEILAGTGLDLQSDHVRDVSVQRTLKPSVLTERLYIFRKPI